MTHHNIRQGTRKRQSCLLRFWNSPYDGIGPRNDDVKRHSQIISLTTDRFIMTVIRFDSVHSKTTEKDEGEEKRFGPMKVQRTENRK